MIVQQVGMIFPLGNEPQADVWTGGRDELAFPRTGEKAPMVSGLHERHFVRHPGKPQTNLVRFVRLFCYWMPKCCATCFLQKGAIDSLNVVACQSLL